MEKLFKGSFTKPEKRIKEDTSDLKDVVSKANAEWKEISDRAHDYWANEVDFQIQNMEDLTKDERIVNASQQDINDMCSRIAEKILNDDSVWQVINEAIEHYIYHDEFMLGAEKKGEEGKTETESLKEAPEEEHKRTGHTEGNRLPELK